MAPPIVTTPSLSTVYLDNQRVGLMGDPRPLVAKIVAASGRAPGAVVVVRSGTPDETHGVPVQLDDVIDRTAEPTKAIYLTCKPKDEAKAASKPAAHYIAWPMHDKPAPVARGPLPAQPGTVKPRQEPPADGTQGNVPDGTLSDPDGPEWKGQPT